MNIQVIKAFIGLLTASILSMAAIAQSNVAPTVNKPMVIDAAVVDNS